MKEKERGDQINFTTTTSTVLKVEFMFIENDE